MSSHNNNATRRPLPPHHHHTNFPPQTYADLTTSDMQLLAFLFSHPPPPSSSSSSAQAVAAYESHIRTLITTTLPPHLLAKIPLLNTGYCNLHRKLNGLVVESLVEVILVGVGRRRRNDDEGKKDKKDKCPGCILARLVLSSSSSSGYDSNNKQQQQEDWAKWGGRVIFSISKKKWKGSKRIRWMEEWFAAAVGSGCKEEEGYQHGSRGRRRSDESLARIVKPMWDVALELYRQGQQDSSSSSRKVGGERDYIDRYIEAAGDVDRARGEREACVATPPQSAAAAAADMYTDCIARDAGPSCWDESVVETPDARVLQTPRHTPPQASSIYSRMEDGEPFRQAEMPSCAPHEGLRLSRQSQHATRRVLTPSSIYSREQDFDCYEEEAEDDWDYRGTAESQIIESYRR